MKIIVTLLLAVSCLSAESDSQNFESVDQTSSSSEQASQLPCGRCGGKCRCK